MTRNKSGYRRLFINIDISRNRECIYKLNSQRVLKRNCKRGVSLSFSSRSSKSILFLASRKNFKTSCYRANKKDSIVERFRLPYANFNTRSPILTRIYVFAKRFRTRGAAQHARTRMKYTILVKLMVLLP